MAGCIRAAMRERPDLALGPELSPEVRARLGASARYTAITGIAFSLLFLISLLLLTGIPRGDAPDEELYDFYSSDRRTVVTLVALYLFPFAGIAFLWFVVSLRSWVVFRSSAPVDDLLSSAQLVSGILYLALFFASAASMSVNAIAIDLGGMDPTDRIDRDFPLFGNALFFVFAIRMGAIFVSVTTTIGRRYRIMPTWFVIAGYGAGIAMLLSASFNRALILMFPVWTLVLCVLIVRHARSALGERQ